MTETELTGEGKAVRSVGRYEILREAGRGGSGIVYLARQVDLDRRVALKELAAFHAAEPAFARRFLREARLAGSLNHPNVVTVHEYFEDGGTPFIAMEFFERGSLRPLVGTLTTAQVAGVLEGVLSGLAAAEERHIVHRDLKPENVMVTAAGGVKIADFGIAKALQSAEWAESITSSGSALGTPAYMAPELALGNEIGPWTDLYALGVTTYELLAGDVPFARDEMPLATLLRHVNEPIPSLARVAPGVDPRLAAWVDRLLAKDPADRPASAAGAWAELEETLDDVLGPRWRRRASLGAGDDAPALPVAPPPPRAGGASRTTAERTTARLGRRPRPVGWIALGVAALLAAGGGVFALLATRGGSQPPPARPVRKALPDLVPRPDQRIAVAVSGRSVYVADPRGRVFALDGATLKARAVAAEPLGPRSLAVAGGRVAIVDGETLTELSPGTLAPLGAKASPGAAWVAPGPGGRIVASRRGRGGRLCVVRKASSPTCAVLPFVPSGLGVAGRRVLVMNGPAGTGAVLDVGPTRLSSVGAPVAVGPSPHGAAAVSRGRVYLAITRGVAAVDLRTRSVTRLRLPVTPSAVWATPSGVLFATLPAIRKVALVDARRPAAPRMIAVGGTPVALGGGTGASGRGEVVVVSLGTRSVTRLSAATGRRLGASRIPDLGAPAPGRVVLRRVVVRPTAGGVGATLVLGGGRLDVSSLVAGDLALSDGSGWIELWQAGIRSAVARAASPQLSLRVVRRPGRLEVRLDAAPGVFTSVRVRRPDRRTVVLQLRTAARPSGGGGSGGTGSTGGGGTTPKGGSTTGGGAGSSGGTGSTSGGGGGGGIIQF